jgi:prophage antirepressor-like protein
METNIIAVEQTLFGNTQLTWVMTDNGRKAVRASDLVKALGKTEKDTARLLQMNVFPDYRFQSSFGEAKRPAWYLYEHGAVQLATKLDSPECEPFQRWVFETVVKLFTSGGYIMPTATSEQLKALQSEITRLQVEKKELAAKAEAEHRKYLSTSWIAGELYDIPLNREKKIKTYILYLSEKFERYLTGTDKRNVAQIMYNNYKVNGNYGVEDGWETYFYAHFPKNTRLIKRF